MSTLLGSVTGVAWPGWSRGWGENWEVSGTKPWQNTPNYGVSFKWDRSETSGSGLDTEDTYTVTPRFLTFHQFYILLEFAPILLHSKLVMDKNEKIRTNHVHVIEVSTVWLGCYQLKNILPNDEFKSHLPTCNFWILFFIFKEECFIWFLCYKTTHHT